MCSAKTIKDGCQKDINDNNAIVSGLNNVVANYNTVRDTACLEYASNSTWCVPYLLGNVEVSLRWIVSSSD